MTSKQDIAIAKINKAFEDMANIVLSQLDILDSVIDSEEKASDKEIFAKLRENEQKLDNFEIILDNKIIQAIVLYQPVASDLRNIFALYRMMINLERIGDLIMKIYHHHKDLKEKYFDDKASSLFQGMLQSASKMVRNSVLSFLNTNVETAISTIRKDEDLDELNQKLLKKNLASLEISKKSRELILNFVDIRAMISSVERIGDHATNIAEASIYAITGTNIAHQDIDDME
jgi:phosphate transport system protein